MFSIIFVFQSKFIAAFGIIIVACHRHQYVNCKENSELFHGIETGVLLVDFGIFLRPFSFVLLNEWVYMYVSLLLCVLLLIRFFLIRIFFLLYHQLKCMFRLFQKIRVLTHGYCFGKCTNCLLTTAQRFLAYKKKIRFIKKYIISWVCSVLFSRK